MRSHVRAIALTVLYLLSPTRSFADDTGTDAKRAEARELAEQGDEAFAIGRCDRALRLWKEADATFHAPTIAARIARCQALLGKVVEATTTLENLVREARRDDMPPAFEEAIRQAVEDLPNVRARIALLTVIVDARGASVLPVVQVDDKPLAPGRSSVLVDPGEHRVRVIAGKSEWEQKVEVEEASRHTLRLALRAQPSPATSRPQRAVGMVLGGLGIASMAIGGLFGWSASSTSSDLGDVCGTDRKQCPADRQQDIDRLRSRALIADLTLGGGAALFAAGAIVLLTEPPVKKEEPKFEVFPVALGMGVRGAF